MHESAIIKPIDETSREREAEEKKSNHFTVRTAKQGDENNSNDQNEIESKCAAIIKP